MRIINDTSKRYYSLFVQFNPYLRNTKWDKIAIYVQEYCLNFLNLHDYGDNLMSTKFNFYVQQKIDIDAQVDFISTASHFGLEKSASLSIHFDYQIFERADKEEQTKIALNAILYLLNYWNLHLKVPKGNPLDKIIEDFESQLKKDNVYIQKEYLKSIYIKFTNPFRIAFGSHYIDDISEKELMLNVDEIEKFINNRIYNMDFGKSIRYLYFSYDIFDFDNIDSFKKYYDEEKKYQYGKNKDLSIMEQYDSFQFLYNDIGDCVDALGQTKYFHQGILNAIVRISTMNRKPRYLDVDKLYRALDAMLLEYEQTLS